MKNTKKELGQFYTDEMIAGIMVDWVIENNPDNILDPAVGSGVFMEVLEKRKKNIDKFGCEIDPNVIKDFFQKKIKSNVLIGDYLRQDYSFKFDAIICNPPYNRFQNIPCRTQYLADFEKKYKIKLSGYSNLYMYFLIKSINELSENGRCCYIVPYEFLNTGYGKK